MADAGPSKLAPTYALPLPLPEFAGIEYPGPVHNVDRALNTIGGLNKLARNLVKAVPDEPVLPDHAVELSFNPESSFGHPVPATVTHTGNIVLKLTRRRRKKPVKDDTGNVAEAGVFSVHVAGVATKTVRFRAMADFQRHHKAKDPITDLMAAMRSLDAEAVTNFQFSKPTEHFPLEAFLPPPVFSRQIVPQMWDLKPVKASVKTTSVRADGEQVERYINTTRYKGRINQIIAFDDELVPQASVEKPSTDERALAAEKALLALLEQRPMWTRTALVNQLDDMDAKFVMNTKQSLPAVSWTFSDGPFRDLCIRFGYDPRKDPEARFLQHILLRNVANQRFKAAVTATPNATKPKPKEIEAPSKLSHTFNGTEIHSNIGNFQLCDISDPLITQLVNAKEAVGTECGSGVNGWYKPHYFDQIKQVVRRKFMGIHAGHEVTDNDCVDLLGDPTLPKAGSRRKQGQTTPATEGDSQDESEQFEGSVQPDSDDASETASREGSHSMDVDEDEQDEPQERVDPTSEVEPPSSTSAATPTRHFNTKKQVPRAPWEPKKKKYQGPKKSQGNAEELLERLRRNIGVAGARDKTAETEAEEAAGEAERGEDVQME